MTRTPDEIKTGLECCHAGQACECTDCPYSYEGEETMNCDFLLWEDALALIQQLESKIECSQMTIDGLTSTLLKCDTIIQQLEAQVPRWIPVEEQPEPPEDDVYYCYGYWIGSGRKQAETAEYLCGEWKIANNFVLTHWMPLPEPPNGKPPIGGYSDDFVHGNHG